MQIYTEGSIEQKQEHFITNRNTMLRYNVFITGKLQQTFSVKLVSPEKPKQ